MLSIHHPLSRPAAEAVLSGRLSECFSSDERCVWTLEVYRSGAAALRLCGVVMAAIEAGDGLNVLDANREPFDRAAALMRMFELGTALRIDDFRRARLTHELAGWIAHHFD